MVKVDVEPGSCGFSTTITVEQSGPMAVKVDLQSQCPYVESMSRELDAIDAYRECFKQCDQSRILEISNRHCQHFACPVPIAIIKGIEVALGINEPKNVNIKITKEDNKTSTKRKKKTTSGKLS